LGFLQGAGSLSQKRLFLAVLADLIAPLQILVQVDDDYTELSAQLDWHIYEAQCKVNAVKSIAPIVTAVHSLANNSVALITRRWQFKPKTVITDCLCLRR
jgi:hypothetical protein